MSVFSTFFGIVLGISILLLAVMLTAEDPASFISVPGLIIVLGGTMAATLVSYPLGTIGAALSSVGHALISNRSHNLKKRLRVYTELMTHLRKGELKEVEKKISTIHSPYLESALRMAVDGDSLDDIMKILNWRMERTRMAEMTNASVFRSMAGYAPAFGMLGTLLGLVNMLTSMDVGDFEKVGVNMAVALVTTFYGLVLSNILFKPLAVKLEQQIQEDTVQLNVAKEAVSLLSQGKPPAYTRELLDRLLDKSSTATNV